VNENKPSEEEDTHLASKGIPKSLGAQGHLSDTSAHAPLTNQSSCRACPCPSHPQCHSSRKDQGLASRRLQPPTSLAQSWNREVSLVPQSCKVRGHLDLFPKDPDDARAVSQPQMWGLETTSQNLCVRGGVHAGDQSASPRCFPGSFPSRVGKRGGQQAEPGPYSGSGETLANVLVFTVGDGSGGELWYADAITTRCFSSVFL
jgi:hypothetical protein